MSKAIQRMIKILYFFFMVLSFDLIIFIPVIHVCAKLGVLMNWFLKTSILVHRIEIS